MSQSASLPVLPRQSLRVVPGSARDFELWRWAVSPLFDMDAATPEGRTSYAIQSAAYLFGEMTVSAQQFAPSRFDRSSGVIARAGLGNILVQVYQQGDYLFSAGGAERVARTGDIVVFDLTRPSRIQTEAASSMSVIVPRRLLAPLVTTLDGIHGRVIHGARRSMPCWCRTCTS